MLTLFSLYTIRRNKPASNYVIEDNEETVKYDEADEARFLDHDPEKHSVVNENFQDQSEKVEKLVSAKKFPSNQTNHLKDFLSYPQRAAKFDFLSCQMKNCFDYSRCRAHGPLKVHIVPTISRPDSNLFNISGESNIIHQKILDIIRKSHHYEPDPRKACIFIPEDDTLDRDPLSSSFRSDVQDIFQDEYGFGMNYLIFNIYSGSWPNYKEDDFSGLKVGAAILAKASNNIINHRNGFDISIPLFSYLHPQYNYHTDYDSDQSSTKLSVKKKYFLTFKGKRYVIGTGSTTRNSLYHLNNQRDVIMLTTCKHGKHWRDIKDSKCIQEEENYNRYDFIDLMKNSTFCLVPRGRRLGSFRFLESMSNGCIPVVLGDGWVWPFDEIIDWSDAAIQFDEDQLLLVPDLLRDISPEQVTGMRLKCDALYEAYFSSIETIVLNTLKIIENRVKKID